MAGSGIWKVRYNSLKTSDRQLMPSQTLLLPPLFALSIYLLSVYLILPLYQRFRASQPRGYSVLQPFTQHLPSATRLFNRRDSSVSADSLLGDEELEEGLRADEQVFRRDGREERRLSRELERGFKDDSDEEEENRGRGRR